MIDRQQNIAGLDVSRETIERLEHFGGLIEKWTKSINIVSPSSVSDLWQRHITDSAQLMLHSGDSWSNWVDLGSGGGLPGLVIAILDQQARPITLIESDTRKCLFLNTVRRELDLNVQVLNQRIEDATLDATDIISARALAPLKDLLPLSDKLIHASTIALFSKGAKYQDELDEALKTWKFEHIAHPSLTHPDARVLQLSRIQRREP